MTAFCPICQKSTFKTTLHHQYVCINCQTPVIPPRRYTMSEKRRQAYARLWAIGHFSKAGEKGGNTTKRRKLAENANYYSDIGTVGGLTLASQRGTAYMGMLGRISAEAKKGVA